LHPADINFWNFSSIASVTRSDEQFFYEQGSLTSLRPAEAEWVAGFVTPGHRRHHPLC